MRMLGITLERECYSWKWPIPRILCSYGSDNRFGLVDMRGLKKNILIIKQKELFSVIILTICGTSFCGVSVRDNPHAVFMLNHHTYEYYCTGLQ